MPLEVHVWGFAISKETHLKTSFWFNENWLRRFYKYEGRTPWDVRKRFYDYQLSHRAGALKDFPIRGREGSKVQRLNTQRRQLLRKSDFAES